MSGQGSMREIRGWKDKLTAAFASVLFLGCAPVASGTVASVPAVGVAALMSGRPVVLLLLAGVLFILGVAASSRVEEMLGRKDPGEITIDEFVGMLVAFLWLPITLASVVAVFLLFRFYDIVKPFPAGRSQRLRGGLGVMADDVIAGIYANLTFRIIEFIFHANTGS